MKFRAAIPGPQPLAHMLHALKQPLTGLHCSLELALVGQRTPEQYVRTLREGLELAGRMSVLVAAIGELVETELDRDEEGDERGRRPAGGDGTKVAPVAETREILFQLQRDCWCTPRGISWQGRSFVFSIRLLVWQPGGDLRIRPVPREARVRWSRRNEGRNSRALLSRPELGLLLAGRDGNGWATGPGRRCTRKSRQFHRGRAFCCRRFAT